MTSELESFARATMANLTFCQALLRADGLTLMMAEIYAAYERQRRGELLAELAGLLRARAAVVERWQNAYFAGELGHP